MINNSLYIKAADFGCVGDVTVSCNPKKLCIPIDDAFTFDVEPLLCVEFMFDVLQSWKAILDLPVGSEMPEPLKKWNSLIFGDYYPDCNGKYQRHLGIKRLWIYYAYSHYILTNPFDDTPNGLKYKTNEFSVPVPIKDLNSLSTSYRNKAIETYKSIKEYLCLNKDFFTMFDACDCTLSCGCEGSCGCGKTKKVGAGFRYKSVKKKL